MTDEAYEAEQDKHLRDLDRKAKVAEEEVKEALIILAQCHEQKKRLLMGMMIALVAILILSSAVLTLVSNGH